MKGMTYNKQTRFTTKVIRKGIILLEVDNSSKQIRQRYLKQTANRTNEFISNNSHWSITIYQKQKEYDKYRINMNRKINSRQFHWCEGSLQHTI